MNRLLISAAALAAMLGAAGLAEAQAYPPPPGTEPAAPRSPDPTLPFQAPGTAETNPRIATSIGCRMEAGPNNGGTPGGLTPAPAHCP